MTQHHRKAYGSHRAMTPEQRARNIAASILLHREEGHTRTMADYGIEQKPEMVAMVEAILQREEM
jgi:hypothetical protein